MAIDYGDKRIGVALSDPMHTISYPFGVIKNIKQTDSIDKILEIAEQKEVEIIVIGLPLSMSGKYSEQTKKVILFKDLLEKKISDKNINITIKTLDERLSSVSAKNIMIEKGIKTGHNKEKIDELSAAIILQEYLDSK